MNCRKGEYATWEHSSKCSGVGLDLEDKEEVDGDVEEMEEEENDVEDEEEDCDEDTVGNREGSEDENEGDMDMECTQGAEPTEVESDKRNKKERPVLHYFQSKNSIPKYKPYCVQCNKENDSGYCYGCYPEIKKITKPKFYLQRIENRRAKIRAHRQLRSRHTLGEIMKSSTELHLRIQKHERRMLEDPRYGLKGLQLMLENK